MIKTETVCNACKKPVHNTGVYWDDKDKDFYKMSLKSCHADKMESDLHLCYECCTIIGYTI